MQLIHNILQAIESDWRLLVLFGLFMFHISAVSAIGIFFPNRIWKPRLQYKWIVSIMKDRLWIGGFEWVGFGFDSMLYDSQYFNVVRIGFYYIHWIR